MGAKKTVMVAATVIGVRRHGRTRRRGAYVEGAAVEAKNKSVWSGGHAVDRGEARTR